MIEQKEICGTCGTREWEFGTGEHPLDPYEPDGYVCPGCALLEAEKQRREDKPTEPGMRLVLYPKGQPDGT